MTVKLTNWIRFILVTVKLANHLNSYISRKHGRISLHESTSRFIVSELSLSIIHFNVLYTFFNAKKNNSEIESSSCEKKLNLTYMSLKRCENV